MPDLTTFQYFLAVLALLGVVTVLRELTARGKKGRATKADEAPSAASQAEIEAAHRANDVWKEVKGLVDIYLLVPATNGVAHNFETPLEKFAYEAGAVYYIAQQKLPKEEAGLLIARFAVDRFGLKGRDMFNAFNAMPAERRTELMQLCVDDVAAAMEAGKAAGGPGQ